MLCWFEYIMFLHICLFDPQLLLSFWESDGNVKRWVLGRKSGHQSVTLKLYQVQLPFSVSCISWCEWCLSDDSTMKMLCLCMGLESQNQMWLWLEISESMGNNKYLPSDRLCFRQEVYHTDRDVWLTQSSIR